MQVNESIVVKSNSYGEGRGEIQGLQVAITFGDNNGSHTVLDGTVRDNQRFISGTYVQYPGDRLTAQAESQRGTYYLVKNGVVDVETWESKKMDDDSTGLFKSDVYKMFEDRFMVADRYGTVFVVRPQEGDSDDVDIYSPSMNPDMRMDSISGPNYTNRPTIVSGSGLFYVIGQQDTDSKIIIRTIAYRDISEREGEISELEEYYLPGEGFSFIVGTVNAAAMYENKLFMCSDVYIWEFVREERSGKFEYVKHKKLDSSMKMPLSMIVSALDDKPVLIIGGTHNDSEHKYFLQTLDLDFNTIQTNNESMDYALIGLKLLNMPCRDISDNANAFIVVYSTCESSACLYAGQWWVENFDRTSDGKNFYCHDRGQIMHQFYSPPLAHTVTVPRVGEFDMDLKKRNIDIYVNVIASYKDYPGQAVRFKSHYLKHIVPDEEIDMGANRIGDYGVPFGVVYGAPPQALTAVQKEKVLTSDGINPDGGDYSNIHMVSSSTVGEETGWQNSSVSTVSSGANLATLQLYHVDYSITSGEAKTIGEFVSSDLTQYIYAKDSLGYTTGTILAQVPGPSRLWNRKYEIKKDEDTSFDNPMYVKQQYTAYNENSVPTTVDFSLGDGNKPPKCLEFDLTGMMGAPRTLDIEKWTEDLFDFLSESKGKKSYINLANILEFSSTSAIDYDITSGSGMVDSSSDGLSYSVGLGPTKTWGGVTISGEQQAFTQNIYSSETSWGISYHPLNGMSAVYEGLVDLYSITVLMLDPYVVRRAGRDAFWISDDMNKRGFTPWCIIYMITKDE